MCHEAQLQPLMDHAATAAGPVKSFWVPFPNARTYSYSVPLRGRTSIFHKSKKRSEAHCTGVSIKHTIEISTVSPRQ